MLKRIVALASLVGLVGEAHGQVSVPRDISRLDAVDVRGIRYADPETDDTSSYQAESSSIGDRMPMELKELPQSVSVITQQRIRDQNLRTTLQALQQVPSVGNAFDPEGGFTIRGFGALTAVNGVASPGLIGRTAPDIAVFDRIEVLKGPAGLFSGGGAPGGVVDYEFKRPHREFGAEATLGTGTEHSKVAGIDLTGSLDRSGSLRARGIVFNDDRNEYVDVERHQRASSYGVLEYDLTPSTTASLAYYQQVNNATQGFRQGLPTYEDGGLLPVSPRTSVVQDWSRWHFKAHWWMADLSHRIDDRWTARLAVRDGRNQGPSWYSTATPFPGEGSACGEFVFNGVVRGDPRGGVQCFSTAYYNDINTYHNMDVFASGAFDLFGRTHELTIGANQYRNSFARQLGAADGAYDFFNDTLHPDPHVIAAPPRPDVEPASPSTSQSRGVYARSTIHLSGWLKLALGGRFTWAREQASGSLANRKFTPYAGLVADIDRHWTTYVSYTTIFDTTSYVRAWTPLAPNGRLLPLQSGKQYEAGVKTSWFDDHLTATTAIYRITLDNTSREDRDHPGFSLATGQQRTQGFEFEVQGEPVRGWSIGLAYAYMDATYTQADIGQGERVGNTPRSAVNLFTNYRVDEGPLHSLSFGGGARYVGRVSGDLPDVAGGVRVDAPGYVTSSLRAGYELSRDLDMDINIDNLFDRRYWQGVGSVTSGNYLGAGRTAMATLHYAFR